MTPDQYRREGAEAMRAYIANGCDPSHLSRSDNPTEFHAGYRHAAIQRFTAIRAIDVDEVLAGATETPRAWRDVMGERVRQITASSSAGGSATKKKTLRVRLRETGHDRT